MSRTLNISLPDELVAVMDRAAKASYCTRSDFIRESVVERLKSGMVTYAEVDVGAPATIEDDLIKTYPELQELIEIEKRFKARRGWNFDL